MVPLVVHMQIFWEFPVMNIDSFFFQLISAVPVFSSSHLNQFWSKLKWLDGNNYIQTLCLWYCSCVYSSFLHSFPFDSKNMSCQLPVILCHLCPSGVRRETSTKPGIQTPLEGAKWVLMGSNPTFNFQHVLGSKLPLFPYNRGWSSTQ